MTMNGLMLSSSGWATRGDPFDIFSLLIDGKVHYIDNIKKLKYTFGKPDSIAPDRAECCTYFDEENTHIYWYGKTQFEVYKDSAVFEEINVEDGKFFLLRCLKFCSIEIQLLPMCKKFFPLLAKKYLIGRYMGIKAKDCISVLI